MTTSVRLKVADNKVVLRPSTAQKEYPSRKDIMKAAYPVNSLWTTEDADADPAEVLGFGTWTKVSPGAVTWEMLEQHTWNMEGTIFGYYIWKRIE